MNDTQEFNTYTPYPTQPINIGQSSEVENILGVSFGIFAVVVILILVIFIIWAWSMIAMISLNDRFKEFLEEYRYRGDNQDLGDQVIPSARKEVTIQPLKGESKGRIGLGLTKDKGSLIKLSVLFVLIVVFGLMVSSFL